MLVLAFTLHGPFMRLIDYQEGPVPTAEGVYVSKVLLSGILTSFNVPFRGLFCGADTVWGFVVVEESGGRRYTQAANVMEEGCAGPWVITPQMIRE